MSYSGVRYVYGPVSSRRLGRSLGVDLVPLKTCTYDCIYCQLGRTTDKTAERKSYTPVEGILEQVDRALSDAPSPSFITLAGSGEPTLHEGIGNLIEGLKRITGIPIAVLTNGSLLHLPEVREALWEADVIIPSLDAGDERMFRLVNRPLHHLRFETVVDGIAEFAAHFRGSVWLEVFLLGGLTGTAHEVKKIAAVAERIRPSRIQLNTVVRPPTEPKAIPVSKAQLADFRRSFAPPAEVIADFLSREVPHAINSTTADVFGLLARRPCTLADIVTGLGINTLEATKHLEALKRMGRVKEVRMGTKLFYAAVASGQRAITIH